MNQFVSLLAPNGPSTPGAAEPKFPAATARSRAAAPFSSVLERAEYRAPERPHQHPRNAKANSASSARPKEAEAKNLSTDAEHRPRTREKQKQDKPADEQNQSGAGAVTGQIVQPDETIAPVEVVAEAVESTASAAPAGNSSSATGKAGESNPQVPLLTEGEIPNDTVLTTLTQASATAKPAGDTNIAPNASNATTSAPSVAAANVVVKENASPITPPVSSPLASINSATDTIETITTPTSDAASVDVKSPPPAASAREAEVQLALATEEKLTANPTLAPEESLAAAVTATVAPEEARLVARAARRFRAETLENVDGIGGAKSSETMKTVIKKEELAGVTQQLLPGSSATPVSTLTNLPGEPRRLISAANPGGEALQVIGKVSPAPVRADVTGTGEAIEVRAASPLPRVSELISREVRMFKRGGDDLVEVVLTPDTKTQISLRLQWREGQVEVQARCDFGDYGSLNNQWAQLQSSLATHGVRLSHLSERTTTGFTEFFNNPNFAQQQHRDRQPEAPSGRPEIMPASSTPAVKSGPAPTVRRSNRLFDSWA